MDLLFSQKRYCMDTCFFYLLFDIVICFGYCKITVLGCNLTFRCTKRRFAFNWFGIDCYWFITPQTEKMFLAKYEYWCVEQLSCILVVTCRELSITITFLWEKNTGNLRWLSITLLQKTNTDSFPGDIVVNFQ